MRVGSFFSQLVEGGRDQEVLVNEVEGILEQMGHTQDIGVIRQFAFVLPKIMKRIYGKVMINEEGIEKVYMPELLHCNALQKFANK